MSERHKTITVTVILTLVMIAIGLLQSWTVALGLLNLCLISSVMALGVNIQWGYGGLFNAGIMGFAALGGVAAVLVSTPPVAAAWQAGGAAMGIAVATLVLTIIVTVILYRRMSASRRKTILLTAILLAGTALAHTFYSAGSTAIEAVNPVKTGFLGGLGLPILCSWAVGGALAAGAAWLVGKITLKLRADYLAIATLGVSEIIIHLLKNEDWLTRGVKNVTGLPRPVPYEVELQDDQRFIGVVEYIHRELLATTDPEHYETVLKALVSDASIVFVKLCYALLFAAVLIVLLVLANRALNSPWGRMIRSIRDNETAAEAMGKNVAGRHLQIFVIGSAIVGVAGAMLTTLDGQFTPNSYHPLRFTFLIWVMVLIGGSGNNYGAVAGAFIVWLGWVQSEPLGVWIIQLLTSGMDEANPLRQHFLETAQHMRLFVMGLILLLVLRFRPQGILPEASPPHRAPH